MGVFDQGGPPMVTLVCITHNSQAYLPAWWEGVEKQRLPKERLWVVDTHSEDGTIAFMKNLPVQLLALDHNPGYGGAINRLLPNLTTPWVLVMNPDVYLTEGYIETLLQGIHRWSSLPVSAAQGKLLRAKNENLSPTGIIDSAGIRWLPHFRHVDRGSGKPDGPKFNKPARIFGATGACALWKVEVLRHLGGMDEDFFLYREDADLAYRMQWAGFDTLYLPEAVAYHRRRVLPEYRRKLPRDLNYHSLKNRYLLRINHVDGITFLLTLPFVLPYEGMIWLYVAFREPYNFKVFSFLWRERKRLLRNRKSLFSLHQRRWYHLLPWLLGYPCVWLS